MLQTYKPLTDSFAYGYACRSKPCEKGYIVCCVFLYRGFPTSYFIVHNLNLIQPLIVTKTLYVSDRKQKSCLRLAIDRLVFAWFKRGLLHFPTQMPFRVEENVSRVVGQNSLTLLGEQNSPPSRETTT